MITNFYQRRPNRFVNALQTITNPSSTNWIFISGQIGIQITGDADTATFKVERSVLDPSSPGGHNGVALDNDFITLAPIIGPAPLGYFEPSSAWWRLTVTEIQGGSALVCISGTAGELLSYELTSW